MKHVRKVRTRRGGMIRSLIRYVFIAGIAAICLFPLLFLFCTSFMSRQDVTTYYHGGVIQLKLFPDMASLSQYYQAFFGDSQFLRALGNSFLIVGAITVGQTAIAFITAFAMEVYPFRGRNILFSVYVILALIPYQVMEAPQAILANQLHMNGTYGAVILPQVFSAFGICLLRMFMRYMPKDTLEAARLDGCGEFDVLLRVALPQSLPMISAVAFLIFLDAWNMVEAPLIFLSEVDKQPLSVRLPAMESLPSIFCYSLVFLLPPVVFFMKCSDHLRNMVSMAMPKS